MRDTGGFHQTSSPPCWCTEQKRKKLLWESDSTFYYLFLIFIQFSPFIFPYLFIFYFILYKLCLRKFLPFNTLLYFWLFLKLILKLSFHTEFVSFANLIVGLRVCFANISSSFYNLTLTFVYDFSSTHHPHTHNFPPKIPAC